MKSQSTRDKYLQRTYGITLTQYNEILKAQGGGCAICGKTPKQEGRNLAVDHDHKTGEIFGILCSFCNHRLVGRNRSSWMYTAAGHYLSKGTGLVVPKKTKKRKRKKKR